MRVAVLDDYQRLSETIAELKGLSPEVEFVAVDHHLHDIEEARRELSTYEVICVVRERMPMPRDFFAALPRLKLVIFTGAFSQVIDYRAAADFGVTICNAPSAGGAAAVGPVVDHVWALILACARSICLENRRIREGSWRADAGILLHGGTLGLVGLGRIAPKVAAVAHAFGMDVIAWSENLTPERASAEGVKAVTKEDLFANSDVVSIHMRLSARTQGIVGAGELALMKKNAIFINTSRGAIVDEDALADALERRSIRAAGLDVFTQEPLPASHRLQKLENAILTPHVAYMAEETFQDSLRGLAVVVKAWLDGRPINIIKN